MAEYAGFHLLAGDDDVFQLSGGVISPIGDGVHALSNAPPGIRWPKVDTAEDEMRKLLSTSDDVELADAILRFLSTPRGTNRVESEVFIAGERYGTRSSTAIVVGDERIFFAERNFERGGKQIGGPTRYSLALPR